MDTVYMYLMDFTSQPDGAYHWILQLKDCFSRMMWLFLLSYEVCVRITEVMRRVRLE
jgi:hypothetical protein